MITCDGCGMKHLPFWGSTAVINNQVKNVCALCAAILTRLGITVTESEI